MSMRYPGGFITATAPTVNANTAKGVWTLEQAMQYVKAGQWPIPTGGGDPYFGSNTLLLPGQGTNGAQNNTFLDSSTNNFTITRNGNTTQGTFTPFSHSDGYWGNYFGTSAHFLNVANNAALNLSGGAYTIEGWVYPNGNYANYNVLAAKRIAGGGSSSAWEVYLNISNGVLGFYNGTVYASTITPPSNQWSHFAAVYSGTEISLYLNGSRVLGPTTTTNTDVSVDPVIGSYATAGGAYEQLFGYLSNVRITKGAALYTGATYTVPTGPLTTTVSSGTVSLLTCQSNRFKDNSVNAAVITATGSPSIQTFQPFGAPTSAYSAATIGGSGYFDGTGDYLTAPSNSAFAFGTGAYTVEAWVYLTAFDSASSIIFSTASATDAFNIGVDNNGSVGISKYGVGGVLSTGASEIKLNSWNHVAAVRTSTGTNDTKIYVNGVLKATGTDSNNWTVSSAPIIGSFSTFSTYDVIGYLSDVRVVKGTAVYTAAFNPPTAPLTAITNTSLLLNFTNAGVIDNAVSNNLETVGSASISTAQYKWGSSSMYFDGTGDYLTAPAQQNIAFGTGDFTIECWIYFNSVGNAQIASGSSGATTNAFYWQYYSSQLQFGAQGSAAITAFSWTPSSNTWYHVAVVRAANTVKQYINGNNVSSATSSHSFVDAVLFVGFGGAGTLNGYVQDLRITKGYARYLYNFTAPTAAFPLFYQAAAYPSSDPYFENTTLLLPGNGTNGAQNNTFLDSSTNAFTITRNGNTTQGTFTPFSKPDGRWSIYQSDSASNYINFTTSAGTLFQFTGDYTIEMWVYLTSIGGDGSLYVVSDGSNYHALNIDTTNYNIYINSNSFTAVFSHGLALNQWNHIAMVRSGSTITVYTNGTSKGTITNSGTNGYSSPSIARNGGGTAHAGYTSNYRVVKGTAVYTAAFIPPTAPLSAISGTSLLTCQNSRFVDNSTNALAITLNGTPSIETFSPFPTTAAYSAGTNGGSGYFDGTGDYLNVARNAALTPTGDFTYEIWVYPTATPDATHGAWLGGLGESGDGTQFSWTLKILSNLTINLYIRSTNVDQISTETIKLNQWNYIAVTRQGSGSNNLLMVVNGVSKTFTDTGSLVGNGTPQFTIGADTNGDEALLTGYVSGARLLNGTGYTSISVPTAPPTAITNTSFLANFTNGGIIDNTMSNDLETVGGASISTTQSKWGGSSMFFDGNGDYLIMPNVLTGQFRTGDFTIEYWDFHGTQGTNYANQVGNLSSGTPSGTWRFGTFSNLGGLYFAYHNGSGYVDVIFGSTLYNDSTWRHFAISRYNGVLIAFVNGIQVGAVTACTQDFNSSNRVILGAELVNPTYFTGYLQDVRVTKGIARYVQNFTPPIQAFQLL